MIFDTLCVVPLLRPLTFTSMRKNITLRMEYQKIMFDTRDKNDSHMSVIVSLPPLLSSDDKLTLLQEPFLSH